MTQQANNLPVMQVLPALRLALAAQNNAVLVAPPGAGKTTMVPLDILEAPWLAGKKIVMLEPRRLAARASARRMSQMIGEQLGQTIGHRMRMDVVVSARTRIEVVTEGVFTRQILADPEIADIGCVIFDEFHERSLDADFGLALALDVQSALRPDLRILVMSATLDGAAVASLLGKDTPVIESAGRMFPVEIRYAPRPPDTRLEDAVASAVLDALKNENGSILAFLPGQGEILRLAERLENRIPADAFIAPLYGALDGGAQDRAIAPAANGQRKIVLATSIAQTSLTIEGVRVVIDSGLVRAPVFEPGNQITRLETINASMAVADQRAGRAGRTEPGVAIRLWHQGQNAARPAFDLPEIARTDLSGFVLDYLSWGATTAHDLALLDPPPRAAVDQAIAALTERGAIDERGQITPRGQALRALPLPIALAAMVYDSDSKLLSALLAALLIDGRPPMDLDSAFADVQSGRFRNAKVLKNTAIRYAALAGAKGGSERNESANVGAMLVAAFPGRIAKNRGVPGQFIMANGRGLIVEENSPLASCDFIIAADLTGKAKNARLVAGARLTLAQVEALSADKIVEKLDVSSDPKTGKMNARLQRKLGAITLSSVPRKLEPSPALMQALCDLVRDQGLKTLPISDEHENLVARLQWLHHQDAQMWPDFSAGVLAHDADIWLAPMLSGKTGLDQLSAGEIRAALLSRIDHALHRQIDKSAPAAIDIPTGRCATLHYGADGAPPKLTVKPQELYGLDSHLTILNGRIPVLLELISPAGRPIQTTLDLPGFWRGSWKDVRAEMRGRYPKHDWPENPASASPSMRPARRK